MKRRTRYVAPPEPRPANPLLPLAWTFVAAAVAIIAVTGYYYATTGVYLPTFFTSVREYNEAQATAQVIGTPRPAQDAHQAAPAAPGRAQGGAPVSQPAEDSSAPLVKATPAGKVDAAPAVLAAPEPPKATPAGKAEPTPEPKRREGKGTP